MTVSLGRRRWAWLALGVAVIGLLSLVKVTIVEPRINVRWRAGISAADRAVVERRYDLRNATPLQGTPNGWGYELGNGSAQNLRAMIQDPAIEDTGNIDRDALTAPERDIRVTTRPIPFPLDDLFDRPSQHYISSCIPHCSVRRLRVRFDH